MEIKKISIEGFANIESAELTLQKFNALVALNNYGKSNLINAIDFAVNFIRESTKDKMDSMAYGPVIPINKHIQTKSFKFEITFTTTFLKESHLVVYGFSFDWIKNDKTKGQRIREEYLKIKSNKLDSKFKTYLDRNLKEAFFLSSQSGRCDKELKIDKKELAINKLRNYDDLFYLDIVLKINNIQSIQIDTLQDPDSMFRRINPKIIKTDYSLDMPNEYDVGFFVYSLKVKKPALFELLIDSFKSLLSNIVDVDAIEIDIKSQMKLKGPISELPLDFPEKFYDVAIKDTNNNQKVSITSISSGSQKIFFVLAMTIASEINKVPLITFEELENSIHPGLLQKLLIILDGLTEYTKIILTSHSPYLIQYLDFDRIKIGIPNDKGLAMFKELRKAKFKTILNIAEDAGISIGDVIFDKMLDASMGNPSQLLEFCNG